MPFEQRRQFSAKPILVVLLLRVGTGCGHTRRSSAVHDWESNPESTFQPTFVRSHRQRPNILQTAPAAYHTYLDTQTVPVLSAPQKLQQGDILAQPSLITRRGGRLPNPISPDRNTAFIKAVEDLAKPRPAPNLASPMCDAYFSLGVPCQVEADGGKCEFLRDIDLDEDDFVNSLTISTGDIYIGPPPSAFDTNLVTFEDGGGITLETRHDDGTLGFTFPDDDVDYVCCSYHTFATSMVAGKSLSGYGFYEVTMSSTAVEFTNTFWFQGKTAEINVLAAENGQATVSWYCFADQADQQEGVSDSFPLDIAQETTATLFYSEDRITVLVNGARVYSVATPECLKGAEMKPIFSVEVGQTLPSVERIDNGNSFGAMKVKYFRSWETEYIKNSLATDDYFSYYNKDADRAKTRPREDYEFNEGVGDANTSMQPDETRTQWPDLEVQKPDLYPDDVNTVDVLPSSSYIVDKIAAVKLAAILVEFERVVGGKAAKVKVTGSVSEVVVAAEIADNAVAPSGTKPKNTTKYGRTSLGMRNEFLTQSCPRHNVHRFWHR